MVVSFCELRFIITLDVVSVRDDRGYNSCGEDAGDDCERETGVDIDIEEGGGYFEADEAENDCDSLVEVLEAVCRGCEQSEPRPESDDGENVRRVDDEGIRGDGEYGRD